MAINQRAGHRKRVKEGRELAATTAHLRHAALLDVAVALRKGTGKKTSSKLSLFFLLIIII